MKYFIEVSYLGTNFHGWQIQPNAVTVQSELEIGLSTILGEKISIMGSSRTDTGVHARQQYAHFETSNRVLDTENVKNRLNKFLRSDISVNRLICVFPNDHTRFDAINRKYIYRIVRSKDPFSKEVAALYFKHLDIDQLNKASELLLKYTDFQ